MHGSLVTIHGIELLLQRKAIKTLRLAVYPDGRVRVSVPHKVSETELYGFVKSRVEWIKKQLADFAALPKSEPNQVVTGAKQFFFDAQYELKVWERSGRHEVVYDDESLHIFVRPGTRYENRVRVLEDWYRQQLLRVSQGFIEHWQPIIGVKVKECLVRRMRRRWGSCHIQRHKICLNFYLVHRPMGCLEYVIVHELVHLLERDHNKRFYQLLDQFMPNWQEWRQQLNQESLAC